MNNNALKEMSILLAEIEAIKIEVEGMKAANSQRRADGVSNVYPEREFARMADEISAIIKKMQAVDTRPGVS